MICNKKIHLHCFPFIAKKKPTNQQTQKTCPHQHPGKQTSAILLTHSPSHYLFLLWFTSLLWQAEVLIKYLLPLPILYQLCCVTVMAPRDSFQLKTNTNWNIINQWWYNAMFFFRLGNNSPIQIKLLCIAASVKRWIRDSNPVNI